MQTILNHIHMRLSMDIQRLFYVSLECLWKHRGKGGSQRILSLHWCVFSDIIGETDAEQEQDEISQESRGRCEPGERKSCGGVPRARGKGSEYPATHARVKRPERNTSVFNWGGTAGTLSPDKGRCFFYFSVPEC